MRFNDYAEQIGVTPRTLRTYRSKGMPGVTLVGRCLHVAPALADPWIENSGLAPGAERKIVVQIPKTLTQVPSTPPAEESTSAGGQAESMSELQRIDRLINVLIRTIEAEGTLGGKVWDRYDKLSKRRAALAKEARDLEDREQRLMPRDQHEQIIGSIAALIRQEIESVPAVVSDSILEAMGTNGLAIIDAGNQQPDAKRALRSVTTSLEDATRTLLNRISDVIEASEPPEHHGE